MPMACPWHAALGEITEKTKGEEGLIFLRAFPATAIENRSIASTVSSGRRDASALIARGVRVRRALPTRNGRAVGD